MNISRCNRGATPSTLRFVPDPRGPAQMDTTGVARHGILRLGVSKQPQLLAVRTHARKGIARVLTGSVAEFISKM
ncbi:MAG: hypothetical protein HY286_04870 [Planctomycetes bacterium]|nr:hypothetical protein [Planctomycetota bacterium]